MRVVIGRAAAGVGHPTTNDYVAFRPVDLQIAPGDRREKNPAFKSPKLVRERDAIILDQVKTGGVVWIHQHGVARRAVDGVHFRIYQRVELFASAGGNDEGWRRTYG